MLQEFKDFVTKGNLVELAVAFIMATAFAVVVLAFTEEVMNFIAAILGFDVNFNNLSIDIRDGRVFYGRIFTAVINFLIIAGAVFMMVKAYNKMTAEAEADGPSDEVVLLTEIRDALRNR